MLAVLHRSNRVDTYSLSECIEWSSAEAGDDREKEEESMMGTNLLPNIGFSTLLLCCFVQNHQFFTIVHIGSHCLFSPIFESQWFFRSRFIWDEKKSKH